MEENKITISLDRFLKLYDTKFLNNIIIDYILSYAELDDVDKNKLTIEYNIRHSNFVSDIIKKYYPEKYNDKLKVLKEECE